MSNNSEEHRREEKLDAEELDKKTILRKIQYEEETLSPLQSKISNFWYYNKWKVIISLFVIFVVVICCAQTCSNYKEDIIVFYSGSCYPTSEQISDIDGMLSTYLPYDYNNDGSKRAEINPVSVYSDEQVEALNARAEKDDNYSKVDSSHNIEQLRNFDTIMLSGEYSVCIIEEWLYYRVSASGGFRKVADVLGNSPENTINGEAIYLCDTAIYKDNPGLFDGFDEKTVVCLRTESQIGKLFGSQSSGEGYKYAEEYFRKLVNGIQ